MNAADKYEGQLSICSQIHLHHFPALPYLQRTAFPEPISLWLADQFSQERQHGRLKVGKGEIPRYFSSSVFSGALPPRFQPHPLRSQLLLGSLVVSLAPTDGSNFWVLITPLSCTICVALEMLMVLFFVNFGIVHHHTFGFSILLLLCASNSLC